MAKAAKKLVFGVGVNDADYVTQEYERCNGKQKFLWICPFYRKWKSMLERCYSEKCQARQPHYIGCTVDTRWHYFMAFRAWMIRQDWDGEFLDKDLLAPGNRVYGPDTCLLIDRKINMFLTDRKNARGEYPIGVCIERTTGKFIAQCWDVKTEKQEYLGLFTCKQKAHQAWLTYKLSQAHTLAAEQSDPRVAKALIDRYENYHIYFPQAR